MPHRRGDPEDLPGLPTIVGRPNFDTSGFGALLVQNAGLGTDIQAQEPKQERAQLLSQ